MEQPLYIVLEDDRCYCQVADGIATMYIVRRWQMLLPGGRWNNHLGWVMVLGICYNQVDLRYQSELGDEFVLLHPSGLTILTGVMSYPL